MVKVKHGKNRGKEYLAENFLFDHPYTYTTTVAFIPRGIYIR